MLFIFDCDGVLVDSEILAARVDSELLTKACYPITPEEMIQRFAGLTAEDFMRIVAAHTLSALIELKGWSLKRAADYVIWKRLVPLGGSGGLIALNRKGNIARAFSGSGMYIAQRTGDRFTCVRVRAPRAVRGHHEVPIAIP